MDETPTPTTPARTARRPSHKHRHRRLTPGTVQPPPTHEDVLAGFEQRPGDREAAIRLLLRLKDPVQFLQEVDHCRACFFSMAHAVSLLMDIAAPVPIDVLLGLGEWQLYIGLRRAQVLAEIRDLDIASSPETTR